MKTIRPICLIGLISLISSICHADTVVLLHGLCRSSRSMNKMEKALRADGYNVINLNYPSRSATIEQLSEQVFQTLNSQLQTTNSEPRTPIHFVTHSMGGTLLLNYLQDHELPNLGRVVMLAPPIRGSEVTDTLGGLQLYQWINGPAGSQLGTGPDSVPLRLKEPDIEWGVIAGDRSINPILSLLIPGPDDGKVSIARVRPVGATDFLRLHVTHACMMRNQNVIEETTHFLKTGRFNPVEKSQELL